MNAKNVLSKIAKMLTLSDESPIQAKTADGKILQSSNFDVNDDVFEVGADGKLTPAEDGSYTITFTTPEGVETTQVLDVAKGKIEEISTPAEEADETAGAPEEKGEEEMASAKVSDKAAPAEVGEAKSLPNTTDEDPRNTIGSDTDDGKDPIISLEGLHERMGKVEEALAAIKTHLESAAPMEGAPLVSSLEPTAGVSNMSAVEPDEDEELPKLDGAPIDPLVAEANKNNYGKKSANYQSTVLSKMYR